MGIFREHLRRHVVGYVGVFLALTGTAVALPGTDSVDSGDIINGQVKAPDIATNAVSSPKIVDGSVSSADLRDAGVARIDLANGSVNSVKVQDGSLRAADVNASEIQKRVTGSCPAPTAISSIDANGSVACSTPAFSMRAFPNAGTNDGRDFSALGPGVGVSVTCHIDVGGDLTLILVSNPGPSPAHLSWFLHSTPGGISADSAGMAAGTDFPFALAGRRVEGQLIFSDETGVSTINLHAEDNTSACELIGTLDWAA